MDISIIIAVLATRSDVYARLIIRTNKDLPSDLGTALGGSFAAAGDIDAVIRDTVLQGIMEDNIVFASRDGVRIFYVTKPENRMFRVHLEKSLKKDDLKGLQGQIKQLVEPLEKFLKNHGNGLSKLEVEIWSDDSDSIQTGEKIPLPGRFWQSLKEEYRASLVAPFAVLVASFLLSPEPQRVAFAVFNFVVAVITVLLFVVVTTISRPSIVHK